MHMESSRTAIFIEAVCKHATSFGVRYEPQIGTFKTNSSRVAASRLCALLIVWEAKMQRKVVKV